MGIMNVELRIENGKLCHLLFIIDYLLFLFGSNNSVNCYEFAVNLKKQSQSPAFGRKSEILSSKS